MLMVRKVVLSMVATLILGCFGAFAQGQRITGTVVDETGNAVIGAAVVVEGTTRGTSTDVSGYYVIVADANETLEVSYLGYKTQKVAIAGRSQIDLVLESDSEKIEEVVVQAFGTAKKEAFTGSAATIKSEDLAKTQSTSVASALAGKVAGLQTSQGSGSLGSEPSITIRGIGSLYAGTAPLWVIDGVPYDGDLDNINMSDIETMTVLKDAASNALYGARGANGVIMVTTKRAKAGDARVNFDAKWGVNTRARQLYEYATDPGQYYEMHYTALKNNYLEKYSEEEAHQLANKVLTSNSQGGLGYNVFTVPTGQTLIGANGKLNPNATPGYKFTYEGQEYTALPDDWMDELYDPAFRQEYNVSIAGATEKSNFYASFGYIDNNGITDGSSMERYTARLRGDYQAKKWLKVGANMNYTKFFWNQSSSGNEGDGSTGDVFMYAAQTAPIYPVYIRDGKGEIMKDEYGWNRYDSGFGEVWGLRRASGTQGTNPLQLITLNKDISEGNAFGVNGFADFIFTPSLKLTVNGAIQIDETRYTSMNNPYYGQFATNGGILYKSHGRSLSYNLQQLLSYSKSFGVNDQHHVDFLLGHENYVSESYSLAGTKSMLFDDSNLELNGAVVDMSSTGSAYGEYLNEGYFTRAMYEYDGRIFLSASYRRDASSNFHPDHRWGNFWSVGGAWIISRENWFNSSFVNMFKLKASIGSQGNDSIGSYRYTDLYSVTNDGAGGISVMWTQKGNPNITWETNTNINLGIEFGLWNDRLSGSIDVFNRVTSDMLFQVPVASSLGYSSYYDNIGDMVNRGIEVVLNGDIIRTRDVVWSVNVNLTHGRNKVLSLPDSRKNFTLDGHEGFINGSSGIIAEGMSIHSIYMLTYAGPDPETGEPRWWQKDAEGNWNPTKSPSVQSDIYSRKYLGDSSPKVFGGFGTSLYAYGFDLSISCDYQLGGVSYDGSYAGYMSSPYGSSVGYNYHLDLLNSWDKETNPNSQIPRFQFGREYNSMGSDFYLIKSDYLNISNINLGYTFPAKWWNDKISSLRVYVAADNVWYWSARKGFDPRGSGNGNYSPIRTISGGVNITF